ncbi:unnamed protein product [Symbiodinium pilosum]|uniref:Uncharacterized protein n=1 Tax=Symbiodinium pilosum TaxID=2952 RepID=A0A812WCA9_SYMPI|nr:unnamed protein product [Symbiodinium pilosum]
MALDAVTGQTIRTDGFWSSLPANFLDVQKADCFGRCRGYPADCLAYRLAQGYGYGTVVWTVVDCNEGIKDLGTRKREANDLNLCRGSRRLRIRRMKAPKWPSERDPVLANRDVFRRPPHRWAVLAEIELPKGDFLEGGVELPVNRMEVREEVNLRVRERPRPLREEAKPVTQEIKVSFAGQPDVKLYVAESRRGRRVSTKGALNRDLV